MLYFALGVVVGIILATAAIFGVALWGVDPTGAEDDQPHGNSVHQLRNDHPWLGQHRMQ